MRGNPKIEFRFFGAGGSATGVVPILVFAFLMVVACITIVIICNKTGLLGMAMMARIRGP